MLLNANIIRQTEDYLTTYLTPRRHNKWVQYAVTILIVAGVTLLRFGLEDLLRDFPLLLYIPAIFACAVFLSGGAALFATVASALVAGYFFIEPQFSLDVGFRSWLALSIFIFVGLAMSVVTELLRKTIWRLNEAEATKALLLEELGHRTKNDLAIISAALNMQTRATDSPEVREALQAANARVLVVAQAHERLRERGGAKVDLAGYISALSQGLANVMRDVRPIAVRVRCVPLLMPSAAAVQIGLIVNELVTNSFKYAFPEDADGTVDVDIRLERDRIVILIADDGIGCPQSTKPGLGTKLVGLLAKQLGGSVQREPSDRGCRTRIEVENMTLPDGSVVQTN